MDARLQKFMDTEKEGVFIIGHSSALVKIYDDKKAYHFLFDPVWDHEPYGKHWGFYPAQVNCDEILHLIDGCFVSHLHEDHVCERILKKLECPVYIMKGRPELAKRLSFCSELCEIRPDGVFGLVHETAICAYFVPHDFNTIDSSVFIFNEDFCVYHGNDNFLSLPSVMKLEKLFKNRIDVAMLPYAFIHYYPHLLSNLTDGEKELEARRLGLLSIEQADHFVNVLCPKAAIPFGASLFYKGGKDHPLNKYLMAPHYFNGLCSFLAGGYVFKDGESPMPVLGQEYNKILESIENTAPEFEPFIPDKGTNLAIWNVLFKKVEKHKLDEKHIFGVNGLRINLMDGLSCQESTTIPRTEFHFDKNTLFRWLRGDITFEQAIGTRQFRYERWPNVYNLKVIEFYNKYL